MPWLLLRGTFRLHGSCKATVHYDETLGFPFSAYSDRGEEGDGWTVTDFASGPVPDGSTG